MKSRGERIKEGKIGEGRRWESERGRRGVRGEGEREVWEREREIHIPSK